jgi:hypothetical protein
VDLLKGHSELDLAVPLGAAKPGRRSFLKGLVGGLAIGGTALGVLASASPASASAAGPDIDPCSKVYRETLDTYCTNGQTGCPTGEGYTCYQQYELVSAITDENCGGGIDDLGECGVLIM